MTPNDPSFEDRLAAARRGEPGAYRWLWDTYAGPITSFLRVRGTLEIDEVVNDVFLAVFAALPRFAGDEPMLRAWIYRIAHNKRVDSFRRAERRPMTTSVSWDEAMGDVEDEAIAVLGDPDLTALLVDLTPEQRDVVLLRFVADLSIDQVATILDKAPPAVKGLQHRALAQLRKKMSANPHPRTAEPTM